MAQAAQVKKLVLVHIGPTSHRKSLGKRGFGELSVFTMEGNLLPRVRASGLSDPGLTPLPTTSACCSLGS
ncbi:MAG: hypothetical protein CM1200mP35_07420 [Chloroflexota bacterium]|nr:MAG: hypothetical protein CM1200mP35_07420 [Chloroflexota bacterium]